MMWKDSYQIGVPRIDEQHKELFRMTEELVGAAQNGITAEACRKVIGFLKEYVVFHFRDEEEYQASIQYSGIEAHKAEHRQFTKTVLDYEKRLEENGFEEKTLKDLAGTVTAWLIYHVVDTDQKIVSGDAPREDMHFDRYLDLLANSVLEVMESMAGLDRGSARLHAADTILPEGDTFVRIGLVGDWKGEVCLGFSKELALNLLQAMTGMELTESDELVQSALCELTNISCGNAATVLVRRGMRCDITTPTASGQASGGAGESNLCIDTALGRLEIGLSE